jgi:hypothetical protein
MEFTVWPILSDEVDRGASPGHNSSEQVGPERSPRAVAPWCSVKASGPVGLICPFMANGPAGCGPTLGGPSGPYGLAEGQEACSQVAPFGLIRNKTRK